MNHPTITLTGEFWIGGQWECQYEYPDAGFLDKYEMHESDFDDLIDGNRGDPIQDGDEF